MADWLAGIGHLGKTAQRTAASAVLPAVQALPDDEREEWHNAIVDAGVWAKTTLAGKLADLPAQAAPVRRKNSSPADSEPGDTDDEMPVHGIKDAWRYVPGERVIGRGGRVVLTWCPRVTARFVTRDDNAETVSGGTRFTVEVGGDTATIERGELSDGSAWSRFPAAIGGSGRDVRDVLASIVEDQARHLLETPTVPRWTDGRLVLPPARALATAGYLETAGDWSAWCELVKRTADAPKIALMLSMTVAGPFLSQLPDVDTSPIFHANGLSSEGKGTALKVCASVFGDPRRIVRPWGSTANGVLAYLREIGIFTAFRDELGANNQLQDPKRLESVVLTVAEGAERDMSAKTGRYRTPSGRWVGTMMSTGNLSILDRIDNDAMLARVVELDTPLTANGAQSREFKRVAARHYGHAIHKLAALKFSVADFEKATEKALVDIGYNTRGNGILDRHMEHLAHAVVGARILEKMCDLTDYAPAVIKAAQRQMEIADLHLKEKGGQPYDRLWNLVHEFAQGEPNSVPTRDTYLRELTPDMNGSIQRVKVGGWNVSNDKRVEAHYAIMPDALRKLALRGELTDLSVAIKNGAQRKLLATNRKGEYKYNLRVGDEVIPTYALRAPRGFELPETEVTGGDDDVAAPVTGPVTAKDTASDQACYGSSGFSGEGLYGETIPTMTSHSDLAGLTDDELIAITVDPSVPDHESRNAAAALEAREKAASVHADSPEPTPPSEVTDQGENVRQREPQGPKTTAPKGQGSETPISSGDGDAEERENWTKWLSNDQTARWLHDHGIELDDNLARRALAAWHAATVPTSDGHSGVRWSVSPGRTGLYAYRMLLSIHRKTMKNPAQEESEIVTEFTTSDLLLTANFGNPSIDPDKCVSISSGDVNKQFMASAGIVNLGDGEPLIYTNPRTTMDLLKMPGWVELKKDAKVDHYAFADGVIPAGTRIPMPMALYLDQRGVDMRLSRAVVWPQDRSGTRLKPHADLLAKALRKLAGWKAAATDDRQRQAAMIAEAAVKHVYAVDYGGLLRSLVNGFELYRRDWSDQLISLAWANALRHVDRAAYDCQPVGDKTVPFASVNPDTATVSQHIRNGGQLIYPPLAMCKDTVFWAHDKENFWLPPALELSDTQPGKFGPDNHVAITPAIATAMREATPYGIRDAVNEAVKENEK